MSDSSNNSRINSASTGYSPARSPVSRAHEHRQDHEDEVYWAKICNAIRQTLRDPKPGSPTGPTEQQLWAKLATTLQPQVAGNGAPCSLQEVAQCLADILLAAPASNDRGHSPA